MTGSLPVFSINAVSREEIFEHEILQPPQPNRLHRDKLLLVHFRSGPHFLEVMNSLALQFALLGKISPILFISRNDEGLFEKVWSLALALFLGVIGHRV